MKTKLTLNISDKIIRRAKQISAKKKISLSSVVEEFLEHFSAGTIPEKPAPKKNSITKRIRKLTKPITLSDSELKKMRAKHLQLKYGKS